MSARGRSRAWRYGHDTGTVSIEFVLIAPLLFLLLFGMVQFGRAYNAKIELASAVREGARALALNKGDPVATTIDAAPGLDSSSITVTTSGSPCIAGSQASVQARYPFDLSIPFWGRFAITIAAEGVMRCGG